jgi:hypothetical protein
VQGSDAENAVLVLSTSDVDMSMHGGETVRVEGTLDRSAGGATKMLLLPPDRGVQESVLLCRKHNVPSYRRKNVPAYTRAQSRILTNEPDGDEGDGKVDVRGYSLPRSLIDNTGQQWLPPKGAKGSENVNG